MKKCTICGKLIHPKGMGSHRKIHRKIPALTKEEKQQTRMSDISEVVRLKRIIKLLVEAL